MAQPLLHNLPPGIDECRAAVFDVDGTLAREDSTVSDGTIAALRRLADTGIAIIIATGRMAPAAVSILNRMGTSGYAIGCNGAITVHTDHADPVSVMPIEAAVYDRALDFCHSAGVDVAVFTPTTLVAERRGEAYRFVMESNEGMVPEIADLAAIPHADRLKFMIHVSHEQDGVVGPAIRQQFPGVMKTLPEYYEINEPGVSKWRGVSAALSDLGIAPHEVVGMGDSENDLSWLPQIGIPIAMENAFPNVKEVCSYEIGSNEVDSAAEFINRWAAVRESSLVRAVHQPGATQS
ncbi:HAD family hydrolase [Flaviflexus equikiangi]|uniref:HAD family hydrolase n=1 Tax=Flaviflexus equikiangi TaxID=2758573 RepID=UPI0015F3ADD3|nr:HAD family hydrolase [Flaviflexus equikiangi]